MAQLSDDCFAHGGRLMTTAEALALLAEKTHRIAGREQVPLTQALGRILAEDVAAPFAVPDHDNSAVDGYAVWFDDLDPAADTRLPVTGRAAAGHHVVRSGSLRLVNEKGSTPIGHDHPISRHPVPPCHRQCDPS